jgi:hypothetical protein
MNGRYRLARQRHVPLRLCAQCACGDGLGFRTDNPTGRFALQAGVKTVFEVLVRTCELVELCCILQDREIRLSLRSTPVQRGAVEGSRGVLLSVMVSETSCGPSHTYLHGRPLAGVTRGGLYMHGELQIAVAERIIFTRTSNHRRPVRG